MANLCIHQQGDKLVAEEGTQVAGEGMLVAEEGTQVAGEGTLVAGEGKQVAEGDTQFSIIIMIMLNGNNLCN